MWEVVIMLFYISLGCIYCDVSGLWIVPKKDNVLLAAGDVLRLDCIHVYNKDDAVGAATFYKDGAFIPMRNKKGYTILAKVLPGPDTITGTTTLKKEKTRVADSGLYRCDVQDKSEEIRVNVIQVVPVDAVLPTETTDSLELRCNTAGLSTDSNDVRWVWRFRGKILMNDDKYNISSNGNNGILQIKNPDRTNMGKYLCSLTQKNDVKIENPRSVFLRASPGIDNYTIAAHNTGIELKCKASGFPIPVIYWTKDGVRSNITNYAIVNTEEMTVSSWLLLNHIDKDDYGVYSCVANNDIEPFNATAQRVISREETSHLISAGGPLHKQTSSIPFICTFSVIFISTVTFC